MVNPERSFRVLAAAAVSCALAACAQTAARPDAAAPTDAAGKPPATVAAAPRELPLPQIELTQPLMFKLMLAEVAMQRGQLNVAVPAYLEVARETKDPRVARRAAEIAWNARLLPAALEAATLWLQVDPESTRARQTVIALLVNQSRLDDAVPHLEQWLGSDPEQAGRNFLQLSSLVSGHADKAAVLQLIRSLAARYPTVPEASLALAQAAVNAGDSPTAINAAQQALKLRSDWELAALFQAQAMQSDSLDAAIAFLGGFIESHPQANDARLNYARMLVKSRNYQEARQQFEILLGEAPNNAEIAIAVGTLSMQLKDYQEAETQFRRALELSPKEPDAVRIYLGEVNEELKRPDEALKWYASINQGPQFVAAQARYAGVLAKQGRLAEARKYLQAVEPGDAQQRTQLTLAEANLLREANAYQEAFDFLSQAVARAPETADLLYDHAMAAEKVNRLDVVESNLRKVISLRPNYAHAYNALGYTLADRNQRLPEARTLIETAHKLSPDDPFILDSLGWVLYRQGEREQALAYMQRAYAARPDAEIAAHLGEILWVLGRRAEAEKLWAEALRDHPKNEVLQGTIKRLAPVVLHSAQ